MKGSSAVADNGLSSPAGSISKTPAREADCSWNLRDVPAKAFEPVALGEATVTLRPVILLTPSRNF